MIDRCRPSSLIEPGLIISALPRDDSYSLEPPFPRQMSLLAPMTVERMIFRGLILTRPSPAKTTGTPCC